MLVACTMLTVAVREVFDELVTVAAILELLASLSPAKIRNAQRPKAGQ